MNRLSVRSTILNDMQLQLMNLSSTNPKNSDTSDVEYLIEKKLKDNTLCESAIELGKILKQRSWHYETLTGFVIITDVKVNSFISSCFLSYPMLLCDQCEKKISTYTLVAIFMLPPKYMKNFIQTGFVYRKACVLFEKRYRKCCYVVLGHTWRF